jgi:pseudaminic acid synthase
MKIGTRAIGPGHATYIIAEMSANHRQDLQVALQTIKAASDAGADAIKLQTYTPDTITIDSDAAWFRHSRESLWSGTTLYHLYGSAYMPWEWHEPLQRAAREHKIDLFSTPFDHSAVDLLERLEMPAYKVASFELVDIPLIRRVARTGKPIIMSTGMATIAEVDEAVSAAREANAAAIALLKCTSAYPAPPESMNLRSIPFLAERYDVPAGLSDHTQGIVAAVTSVAVGGSIIEKHLTLSRADGGPDAAFSLEPHEFAEMVRAVHEAEAALGKVSFGADEREAESRRFRRSLFVVDPVRAGESFSERNVRSIRPAAGLHTRYLDDIVGKRARQDIAPGTPLNWDLVEP